MCVTMTSTPTIDKPKVSLPADVEISFGLRSAGSETVTVTCVLHQLGANISRQVIVVDDTDVTIPIHLAAGPEPGGYIIDIEVTQPGCVKLRRAVRVVVIQPQPAERV